MKKNKMKRMFGWVSVLVLTLIVGVSAGMQNAGAKEIKDTIVFKLPITVEKSEEVQESQKNNLPVINMNEDSDSSVYITIPGATPTGSTTNGGGSSSGSGNSSSGSGNSSSLRDATRNATNNDNNNGNNNTNTDSAGDSTLKSTKAKFDCDEEIDKYNNGDGFGAMQWILCPALNNTTYTATWLEDMTQGWLEMDPNKYNGGDTYKGWEYVRDAANVVMVIFFLIIVVSQVTGYGIDNYGIKKMLPKLVMMAIIVNLSFYICIIAIDLSNIFGVGFRDMFGAFGNAISQTGNIDPVSDAVGRVFAAVAASAGTAAGAAGTAVALGAGLWAAVVVFLLVAVLVILAAWAVLYFMLAAREILVIFCIIISPLAFVAFVLPNTQDLFKKWWQLFKMAIIIFPICGAVSGISRMLQGMGWVDDMNVAGKIVMMMLPYLVYFLLPMLIKNAIAGLGKIGGALTSMGSGAKTLGKAAGMAAGRGVQKSNLAQDMAIKAKWRRQNARDDHISSKFGEKYYRFGKKKGQVKRPSASEAAREAQRKADEAAENGDTTWLKQRILDKRAQEAAYNARLYTEGKTSANEALQSEEYAKAGGPAILTREVARARAESTRDTQEIKGYTDQYTNYTRPQMVKELAAAIREYEEKRDSNSANKLQAAISTAESMGMGKELLNELTGNMSATLGADGKRTKLGLTATNNMDAKILKRLAASSNGTISQAGKDIAKNAGDTPITLGDYVTGAAPVKLRDAMGKRGVDAALAFDDDTLEYLINNGGKGVFDYEQLYNAAIKTNDGKQLTQLNRLIELNRGNTSGYKMKNADFAKVNEKTFDVLDPSVYQDVVADLKATADTDASRQIISAMDQRVREKVGLDAKSLGWDTDGGPANTPPPTPGPTPTPTPGPTPPPTPGPTPTPTPGPTPGPTPPPTPGPTPTPTPGPTSGPGSQPQINPLPHGGGSRNADRYNQHNPNYDDENGGD